jgi:hypothetical protein
MEEFDITLKVRVKKGNILLAEEEADFICSNMKDDVSDYGIVSVVWDNISPVRDIDR